MKEFLEKSLMQSVEIYENKDIYNKLPLVYRGRYFIYTVEMSGVLWIAIQPKLEIGLVMLRKDKARIEMLTGLNCAIFLEKTSYYIKEKFIEDGIPFVIKDKQVFLPFIGYLLSGNKGRELPPVHLISFLTQKLLFVAIYDSWVEVTVSKAAELLSISRMSASRCFDEIEYLNVDILRMKGKSRVITAPKDKKKFWDQHLHLFRNPVIRRFELYENINLNKKAGISALSEYTLLSDNQYPTYAVTKKEISDSKVRETKQVCLADEIGCVVLELGYFIGFEGKALQDPLSIALSMTQIEQDDERVAMSISKMLEEYVWSRD